MIQTGRAVRGTKCQLLNEFANRGDQRGLNVRVKRLGRQARACFRKLGLQVLPLCSRSQFGSHLSGDPGWQASVANAKPPVSPVWFEIRPVQQRLV